MNILMVIGQFYPTIGGAERQCGLLARALLARGHGVRVLTVRSERGVPLQDVVAGVPVERIAYPIVHIGPVRIGFGFLAPALLGWRVWRRAKACDVIHAHQALWPAFVACVVAQRRQKPIIVKLGNSGERFDLDVLPQTHWYGAFARRFLLRHVTRFVATSRAVYCDLLRVGIPAERITDIPNGVELPMRRSIRSTSSILRAVFVGTLTPKKNVAALLEAMARLTPAERERTTLAIVGDGPERATLERRATVLGIATRVTFRGAAADSAPVLAASDLFVLPSRTEGLSNAALEAMANGCALLLSDAGGNPDLVPEAVRELEQPFMRGTTGLLVDPQSSETIVAGLQWCLAHPDERKRMGERAQLLVEERYSIDDVSTAYEGLLLAVTKPRIVHLLTFLDSQTGGMERQALQLAERFRTMGHEIFFITCAHVGTMRRERLSLAGIRWGFRIYRIPFVRGWRRLNAALYLLGSIILLMAFRNWYDVIHAHQLHTSGLVASLVRRLLPSKRVIIKNATGGAYGDVGNLMKQFSGRGVDLVRRGVNQFVGVSDETVAEMDAIGCAPITCIPNSVRTDCFTPPNSEERQRARRAILGAGHDAIRLVLTVGRLHAQKNLQCLIDACALLDEEYICHIVGDGPERMALERYRVQRGLGARVRFAGAVDDVRSYYHAADIFVLASRSEGMPNVVLEAMACGLPIVGSDIPPMRSLINAGVEGALVDPDDAESFARAIREIIGDADRARSMGQRTRARVVTQYGLDAMAGRYATLYTSLTQRSNTTH